MEWQIAGLPAHILIVHFVVIVVPFAALCVAVSAAWPAARRRLGLGTPLVALAALISVPLATQAGEALERQVGHTALIEAHTRLGDTMLPWAIAVFLVAALQWAWFRYVAVDEGVEPKVAVGRGIRLTGTLVLAALVAVSAVGSVVTVVRIGESGSRAVWSDTAADGG